MSLLGLPDYISEGDDVGYEGKSTDNCHGSRVCVDGSSGYDAVYCAVSILC